MAEVVLFHHIRGLTDGVAELAEAWRSLGHTVHTPDLFEGVGFDSIAAGSAYVEEVGFTILLERASAAVAELGSDLVYAGISLGVASAEYLALSRPGVRGVVMLESAIAPSAFAEYTTASAWPTGLAFQIHGMDGDPFFAGEGELEVAREMVAGLGNGELFLYPGGVHLFCDASLPEYDPVATRLLTERVGGFLGLIGSD